MIMLALGEYIRHFRRNLFIAVQVSALLLTLVVTIATLSAEWRIYRPVKPLENRKGFVFSDTSFYGSSLDELTKGMTKVDFAFAVSHTGFTREEDDAYMTAAVYSDEIIDTFQPDMLEGNWLETGKQDNENDFIDIVVSENPFGWHTGDKVMLNYAVSDGKKMKKRKMKANIKGVFRDGSNVFGHDFGQAGILNYDYRDNYSTYSYAQEREVLVMASESQMKQKGIPSTYNRECFVVYEEDIDEFDISHNERKLKANIGRMSPFEDEGEDGIYTDMETYMKSSTHELQRNLLVYLPIFVCIVIITLISLTNVCTLNMSDNLKQDAVFSLLGMPWLKCSLFSLIQSICTSVIASTLTVAYMMLIFRFRLTKYFFIQFDISVLIAWICTLVLLSLVSFAIPIFILKRKRPVDVLKMEM